MMVEQPSGPLFSVVMATFQRRDVLAMTLPSVCAQDFPADQFEVIVVVDGSTDGTLEMLRELKVAHPFRTVSQQNRGPAAARQAALETARGRYVFFTDDDIRFTEQVLKHHLTVHERSTGPAMVRGSIFVAPESPQTLATDATRQWYEQHASVFNPEKNGVQLPQDFSIFANTSVLRSEIEACGGVDLSVPFPLEGFELLYRLMKRGVVLRSAPDALVFEIFSKPTRKMITSDARGLGKAEWLFCRKHPEYRKLSVFANLARGGTAKRVLRSAILSAPSLPALVLDILIDLADRHRDLPPLRKIGLRALAHRHRMETLLSGIKQAGSWEAIEDSFGAGVPVLMYHHIGPRNPLTYYELTIEPQHFERQISYLAHKGYRTINISQLSNWLIHGIPLPKKSVMLTFDDAYADTFAFAFPILERHGFCAVSFVVSSLTGGMDVWNESGNNRSVLKLASVDQIRTWVSRGIDIGVHTRTHADLVQLDVAGQLSEIVGAKEALCKIIGKSPESFAYPFGHYDAGSVEIVKENFELAFSVIPGLNHLETHPHLLRRIMVDPRNSPQQIGRMLKDGRNRRPSLLGRIRRRIWLAKT
ncbi:glycosyltransferase [Occallatibacter savannae]|uniref:glycosyltransferase n=1 Tax=Occallatibacter savannae TaxID=1002691 RepID=UPI000D69B40D|nr:glycosyltransferase [Occallatibacter savannae]